MSPSRAPVFSCAHHLQAPGMQATTYLCNLTMGAAALVDLTELFQLKLTGFKYQRVRPGVQS